MLVKHEGSFTVRLTLGQLKSGRKIMAPAVTSLPIRKVAVKVVFQATANITGFQQRTFQNTQATGETAFCTPPPAAPSPPRGMR